MRPKAEWAIDPEAISARRILVLGKADYLVRKISRQNISPVKARQNAIQPPFFGFSKPALFAASGILHIA